MDNRRVIGENMREIKYSQEFWLGRREQGDYTDEEYIKIQSERLKELESVIQDMLNAAPLWMPGNDDYGGFYSEAAALATLHSRMITLLEKDGHQ